VPSQCPISVEAFVADLAVMFLVGFGFGAFCFPIKEVLGYLRLLESHHPIRMAFRSQMFVECQLTLQGHLADITVEAMLGFGSRQVQTTRFEGSRHVQEEGAEGKVQGGGEGLSYQCR
jgi:hypothetical protein